jgi:hypothetical protein
MKLSYRMPVAAKPRDCAPLFIGLLLLSTLPGLSPFGGEARAVCVGDCDSSGTVLISEVQRCINRAQSLPTLPCDNADQNRNGTVEPNEVDLCVASFLDAETCPQVFTPVPTDTSAPTATATTTPTSGATATVTPPPTATATATATRTPTATHTATATQTSTATRTPTATDTSTPTQTPAPVCPIASGEYTLTQTTGGTLTVSIFAPFPFPSGGTIKLDAGPGNADCVHETVVPFPGGFNAPTFCVPALGFSVNVAQTGCGVGLIDSDGGSDFTIVEQGDTSDATCGQDQSAVCNTFADSSQRVDIAVGDGVTDVCTGNGTANAITSIPVFTVTWTPAGAPMCPDPDGVFNPGTDMLVTQFPQILDFTTSTNTASFVDLNSDGCKRGGGLGPDGPTVATGACLDLSGGTVTTGAAGTVASSGAPAGDLLFSTTLPNSFASSGAFAGATCASPPLIPLPGGMGMRCFVEPAVGLTSSRSLRERRRGLPLFPELSAERPRRRHRPGSDGGS